METSQNLTFTDRLYKNVKPIWDKNYWHPFVQEIGQGTLEKQKFIYYLKQDYVYLIEYSKLYAIGVQKATDMETRKHFSNLLHNILHFELEIHCQYAGQFGVSLDELEQTKQTPINLAYTNYMMNVAHNGTLAELISCLLPCSWNYWEIGIRLKNDYAKFLEFNPYAYWIQAISSEKFGSSAKWLIAKMDQLVEDKSEKELIVLEDHFQTTSRFEYSFWDMVYHGQDWPL